MIPGVFNIKAYRNDTMTYVITVTDENSAAISFANADVKMQVRTRPDGDIVLSLTEGNGISIGGVGNNIITLNKVVDIEDCGNYHYDLQATFTSGVVSTYIKGLFIVQKDITE
jgi:hypothetical protein